MSGIGIQLGTGLCIALFAGAGCSRHAPTAQAPQTLPVVPVETRMIENKPVQAMEEVVGTVRARLRARLEAKTSGRIEKMLVAQGQAVKRGQLLAELDARETRARLDQALAQREQAQRDLERMEALVKDQVATRAEFDEVQARHRVASGAVREAETMLDYTRILAPFDGVIVFKQADVGDLAVPGKPLFEMEDPSAFRLEADVPEGLVEQVQLGAKLPVRLPNLGEPLTGIVAEITPAADPQSRTFLVKLDLPQVKGLRAGGFGRVSVPLAQRGSLRVPAGAVLLRGQMEIVFVVTNDHAQLRLVKTGKRVADELELVSGVAAGEQVAVSGVSQLLDGQPVQVRR